MILALAMILDAMMGEPRWLWDHIPHPAIVMGRAVGWIDKTLNFGPQKRLKGIAAMLVLGGVALGLGWGLHWLGWGAEILVVAVLLAQKSLVGHVRDVADALRLSLGDARRALARIVGRDTATMERPAIARAAIESAAENLSDGVIAPMFWYLIAGLPGLLLYKITNTADSMIGHRTKRHEEFGWAAARFDDLLNLIPARLTALLIALPHGLMHRCPEIAAEARLHRSPNAGWPEAAMARVLGVALSGPRSYGGKMHDYPYVNAVGQKDIGPDQIDAACTVLWRVWAVALTVALAVALVLAVVLG
ncbi:Adenosylcobinamide-phosphate synthase [hydrothermal vent metagenome]|uniref:Adenosylcobinamide-phosphate synthase n=1 Tax=hydrothermal vent metagenome TaxID=652676 RepID=A0A3B0SCP4_9ZZZZ